MLVIGFGDSITEAKNTATEAHFLYHIQQVFHADTINAGVRGNTTDTALRRVHEDVLRHHPDVCIVQFGLNDSVMTAPRAPAVPLPEFRNNLRTIVRALKSATCNAIVCTMHPIIPGDAETYYYRRHPAEWYEPLGVQKVMDQYNQAIRDLATDTNVVLADVARHWDHYLHTGGKLNDALVSLDNSQMDDGVHLTPLGYELYTQCILAAMWEALDAMQ